MQLADLVVPASTVVLTQECQKGVIGDLSMLPALAESARATGMIENVGRIVKVGRDAGCGVLHCIAATRADRRGASTNAPLFAGTAKRPVTMLPGSEGTDAPTLLRNLGAKTVVIAGVSTNVAIPNATFDCVNAGFNVVIARDAITGHPADYTDVIIQNTLSLVAKICTTDERVDVWST